MTSVAKRLDNSQWRIADRVAEASQAVLFPGPRARGVPDSGPPEAAAGSDTSFTAPVSRAVGEYLIAAAGEPRTAQAEFVEFGSSGFISESMLKCQWTVCSTGNGLGPHTCSCGRAWSEDHAGCLPEVTRQIQEELRPLLLHIGPDFLCGKTPEGVAAPYILDLGRYIDDAGGMFYKTRTWCITAPMLGILFLTSAVP